MKNFLTIILLIVLLITSASRCKKECMDNWNPQCENYDPCFKKVSADFKMGIEFERYDENEYFETDTIIKGNTLTLTAQDSVDVTYEWKIGDDPEILRTRKVKIEFTFVTKLDVRLIVRRKSGCDASGEGTAMVTKKLVVDEKGVEIIGTYEGYLVSKPTEKVQIYIKLDSLSGFDIPHIDGLPVGCIRNSANRIDAEISRSYRHFIVGDGSRKTSGYKDCWAIYGRGEIGKDKTSLTLDYSHSSPSNLTIKDKFIGKKIK